jgi:hypothetical protein
VAGEVLGVGLELGEDAVVGGRGGLGLSLEDGLVGIGMHGCG